MNTFDYIQVTDKNLGSKDAIFDATVIANYGDPGLDEDYHADILSRYVICKLESSNRTTTSDRYKNILVVVKRPENLWISYQGGWVNNPNNQKRADANLNVNVGAASNYTANAIPRMNTAYRLGERIKIRLIKGEAYPFVSAENTFFSSECNVWDANSSSIGYYGNWHTQGLDADPYVAANNGASNLRIKTLTSSNTNNSMYSFVLNKLQYEAFLLSLFPEKANQLVTLFGNNSSFNYYYNANGGYVFSNVFSVPFNFVKYEDLNLDNKARVANTNCVPLIVAAPQTFTVPKTRASGTVNYTPTYIEKS